VLGTNPLEEAVQRRVHPTHHYLYMLVASLYAYGIYAPDLWSKVVVVVLTSLLAFALWQKVKEKLPYLLDPTDAPPPALLLADGLVAAFVFFAIQGVIVMIFAAAGDPREEMPLGPVIAVAFALAGAIVTSFTLYAAWRAKVPRLLETVGLRSTPGSSWPPFGAVGVGLAAGGVAAAAGLAYLKLAEMHPWLRRLKEQSMSLGDLLGEQEGIWLIVLAVVLAPVFEEVIFRGLVFRGLRRTISLWPAALASAALFAIVHPPFAAPPVFVLGVLAAVSFELSGLLIAPVAAHAVYNAVVMLAPQ
jgi:hypothetical protein